MSSHASHSRFSIYETRNESTANNVTFSLRIHTLTDPHDVSLYLIKQKYWVVLSHELQPGEIPNISDRNVVITALPNMTSKTEFDLYSPMIPPLHSDTAPFLPLILIPASTLSPRTPQPVSLIGHAPSPSHLLPVGSGYFRVKTFSV